MVPVFLEPTKDRRIVVFGGGAVAFRKCKQFEGFRITVVAEETVPGMEGVCDEIVRGRIDPDDVSPYLDGAFIAVAATSDQSLNSSIRDSAKAAGVLVNSAHGGGDILLPSSVRKKGYTVAVSSEGSVPAFPPYVAERIDGFLGEEYDLMLSLLSDVRKGLKDRVKTQPERAKLLAEILADEDIWHMLENGDIEGARKAAGELEKKYVH
jgi:siroheme synthase, N-terminal domain